jgi:EmrB/QacA subfamily drug resistance transporter
MKSIDGVNRPAHSSKSVSNHTANVPEVSKVVHPSTPQPEASVEPKQSFFRKWGTLVVLSLALAIIIIDTTVLNVSLKSIIFDLNTTIQSLQWVISAYSLTLSALTITGGRLGDLYGRKKMFIAGAVIFAIGSFVASISRGAGMLLIGESIIEGVGAALMMPATASLLVTKYRGRDRAIAFGVWGGIAAAASAIGPILGGWLTSAFSWRWAFRINIFVATILVLGSVLVPEAMDREEKRQLDFLGIVLSAVGLLGVVYGIIEASTFGWFKAIKPFAIFGNSFNPFGLSITPVAIVAGIVFLILFGIWQGIRGNSGKTPLVSLTLFKNKQFTSGAFTMAIMALGQVGLIFAVPIFLQAVRGLDAFHTGLAMLPLSLALLITAPMSAVLNKYFKPKHLIQAGFVLDMVGLLVLRQSLSVSASVWALAPGLALYGAGMGFIMAQVSNLTLSAVSVQEAGEASGVNNTLRNLGSTLGSAILGAILITSLTTNLTKGINNSSVIPAAAKPKLVSVIAEQSSAVEFGGAPQAGGQLPDSVKAEIVTISHQATVDANRQALLVMIGIVLIALLVSTQLPSVSNLERGTSAAPSAAH